MALVVRGERGLSWVTGRVVIARVGGALVCAVVVRECVALRLCNRRRKALGARVCGVASEKLPAAGLLDRRVRSRCCGGREGG